MSKNLLIVIVCINSIPNTSYFIMELFLIDTNFALQDCLFMGKHCFNGGIYSRSLEWFEEAYAVAALENNKTLRQDQIQPFLDHAAKEVGYVHNLPCLCVM